ncbi:unnamed protein product [Cochlearia groenlandica]
METIIRKAKDFVANGDYIKALEIIEDMILVHCEEEGSWILHLEQGNVFLNLVKTRENPDFGFLYVLASASCFWEHVNMSEACAHELSELAKYLGSPRHDDLMSLIENAKSMLAVTKITPLDNCESEVSDSSPKPLNDRYKGFRSYWVGLDVKIKRNFMKVSIAKLLSFAEGVYQRKGRDALKKALNSAREDRKWTFWICRTLCSMKFSTAEECTKHLEEKHGADFKPSSEKDVPKRIGKEWARKISVGVWEPVNTVAAVEMIKNQLAYVKASTSKKNGWFKEWPLSVDEQRSKLLKEIRLCLVSLCDHKVLSCSIRDWVMLFLAKHLEKLEVSQQSLIDCKLLETFQSICFLECHELNQIRDFLISINCERHDGTDLICRTVDSMLESTRVKETFDFDPHYSFLLLDKRLLKSNKTPFDDEGTINVFDPDVHYAKAPAQGDYMISWIIDVSSVDESFPRPIREHNLDIWMAVLKVVHFTCKTMGTIYGKKKQVLDYNAALTDAENLCKREAERRRNLHEDQWNNYASLLCDRCEERVSENSLTTKLFLCVVHDVFKEASHPTFDFSDSKDFLNLIRESKCLSDDNVLMSIELLKSVVTQKVLLIDSKILLIDNSRIRLLNNLTRLSVFDNRSYILHPLKPFLLSEIIKMESKAKSDAAEADLLLEEEKKLQAKKKRENKKIKLTSMSMSSPLDKTTAEHEPSVNLEPRGSSPSLETVEIDSMEPEDTLASEVDQYEISSITEVNCGCKRASQQGEDSLLESELEGAATRYSSALDMTLKALLSINVLKEDLKKNEQPFHDNLDDQATCVLQNLFTGFLSTTIEHEGVYSVLLGDLLGYLEVVSMSSDPAEVLVTILEFWHCWKNPERESLVIRSFTLEENESMSCRKCKRKSNFPEQSSYGIVIAADLIRGLKCAFGNIKFVDILKLIRMGYEMVCDIKTGGCGKTNLIHHTISRCPPIFIIVLEWEKSEREKEISETTKALEGVIDMSRLYEGLQPNTNYRLVSMVGCGEEKECVCLAYEKKLWVNLRRESLAGEDVGDWRSVVKFCEERKARPEILFYEACLSIA